MNGPIMFFAFGFAAATILALIAFAATRRRSARPEHPHPASAALPSTEKADGEKSVDNGFEQALSGFESGIERLKSEIAAAAQTKSSSAEGAEDAKGPHGETAELLSNLQREAEALLAAFATLKQALRSRLDDRERELRAAAELRQKEAIERSGADLQSLRDELRSKTEAFQATVEILRNEKGQLQDGLAQLRDERDRLLSESGSLRMQLQDSRAEERMENAVLRENISDIAAEVARLAINLEGINSPIERLIAADRKAGGNEDGTPADEDARMSLAERVRKLQARI